MAILHKICNNILKPTNGKSDVKLRTLTLESSCHKRKRVKSTPTQHVMIVVLATQVSYESVDIMFFVSQ